VYFNQVNAPHGHACGIVIRDDIGVATAGEGEQFDLAIARTNESQGRAKQAGRNRVCSV
jgi:PleD family two-component response regulator